MNLTEALHVAAEGESIVSCAGIHYPQEELRAEILGLNSAVCNSIILSDKEKRGRWEIYD